MSLEEELYTKRQYLSDLAEAQRILSAARTAVADGTLQGLQLMEFERQVAAKVKRIKARWAEMGKWFAALAGAKREWRMRMFGEHDAALYRKIAFLKHVVAMLLEGVERPVETEPEPATAGRVWCRERTSKARNGIEFMPDCDYEICTGGRWMPVQREQLPDQVRWI
jgi:hypothetical protein